MTVTVTPTVNPAATPPNISLAITSTTETSTTVQRINPDGSLVPVRTSDGLPLSIPSHSGTLIDYEPPAGQAVSFTSVESPATVSGQVTLDVPDVWLIHCGIPGLSMPIVLRPATLSDEMFQLTRGVFYVLGDPYPVINTDGSRKMSSSQLVVATDTFDDLARMKALLADGSTLLLNVPPALGIGFDTAYIAVGDLKMARRSDMAADTSRDFTLPFQVTRRPVGGSSSTRTYAVVEAAYATYAAAEAAYATYALAIAGP